MSVGTLRRFVPEGARRWIRDRESWRAWQRGRFARRLARTTKRLDLAAAQLTGLLQLAGRPAVTDVDCLEVGAGWVLSHSLVLHLLGARRVVAIDHEVLAEPAVIPVAVREAILALARSQLGFLADPEAVRGRLERLRARPPRSLPELAELGIEYLAPFDLLRDEPPGVFGLVFSNSVLEHVPVEDCSPTLEALGRLLGPSGTMIHAIHLEDHDGF